MNLTDFKKGDIVYHKSNSNIRMLVINTHDEQEEIRVICSWLTKEGKYYLEPFYSYELQHEDNVENKK